MSKQHASVLVPHDLVSLLDQKGNNRAAELMGNFLRIAEELAGHVTTKNVQDGGLDGSLVLKSKSVGTGQIADLAVTEALIAALAVTTAKIAAGAVTKAKLGSDVIIPQVARGRYTGDGTANRVITLPFTPTWVFVLSLTDSIEFSSLDDGTAVARWYRSSAGALSSAATEWQGVTTGGFQTGSNAESLSNKTNLVYTYWALRDS